MEEMKILFNELNFMKQDYAVAKPAKTEVSAHRQISGRTLHGERVYV
jgi:hypothetical protein